VISFLEGEVAGRSASGVVLNVGGVGYDILAPTSVIASLPAVGRTARVHTRMVVRDDAMLLYGFSTTEERTLFDHLTGVGGVGPKVALNMLSSLSAVALTRAIVAGDAAALIVVPGVGKKVAQRVILDLREKLGGVTDLTADGPVADVREALIQLGLSQQEAAVALTGVEADGREVEELLREALQRVGR
jgi:Holliday junction DNA helicase RuvA